MEICLNQLSNEVQKLITNVKLSNQTLTITEDGIPLVIISPMIEKKRPSFGCMGDSLNILEDIVSPVVSESDWEANQ
ncbi:hypothetical protein A5482_011660 [Cyanobacterium sp. IPPAS B-1200]|uniref:hypothetical protein n=1 Tax=Cyanobacterium sp. IPPAS B-1200 TaxID=1562720 RepID=UPI0008525E64|nr:hypothetical protein [Cyanobacterium sp. IPPAS B-1200]OEJ79579.1 hypothetical protein A5482_09910 [Cyanobacterium sp. IPPAS B-1200]